MQRFRSLNLHARYIYSMSNVYWLTLKSKHAKGTRPYTDTQQYGFDSNNDNTCTNVQLKSLCNNDCNTPYKIV